LSGQIIHGELVKQKGGGEAWERPEYRRPTHCGQGGGSALPGRTPLPDLLR
jgi:hypothetical protein